MDQERCCSKFSLASPDSICMKNWMFKTWSTGTKEELIFFFIFCVTRCSVHIYRLRTIQRGGGGGGEEGEPERGEKGREKKRKATD